MEHFTALCSVAFYNLDGKLEKEHIAITYVANFKEAMERVEAYYGNDLASVRITLHCDPFLVIDEATYDKYMVECV